MLGTVRPNYHKAGPLELVLRRLHSLFQSMQPISPQGIAECSKAIRSAYPAATKVIVPFAEPQPQADVNYKLAFEPPSGLQLVGSWPVKTSSLRPHGLDVDVAVVMPSAIFQEKDHLNFRYYHKRAFYLAVLAAAISSSAKDLGIEQPIFETEGSDSKRSVIVLKALRNKAETDFSKLKAEIRIHLAHEPSLFPAGRLAPSRNNIRAAQTTPVAVGERSHEHAATPHYNASILSDSLMAPHLVYLHATAKACAGFADACMLLKVWVFQRGFGSGAFSSKGKGSQGTVRRMVIGTESTGFLLTMILAHLLHGEERQHGRAVHTAAPRKLVNSLSSYQLFRGVLDWLAHHNFTEQPVFMKAADPSLGIFSRSDKIPRQEFAQHFERVFVDPTGSINLLTQWLPGSLDLLQHEARLTFAMLEDAETDHFDSLFLTKRASPLFVFDDCARLSLPSSSQSATERFNALDIGSASNSIGKAIEKTVRRAMAQRARFCTLLTTHCSSEDRSWSVEQPRPPRAAESVELGVVYEGALALRMVEHGPTPEEKEMAADFQAFWGDIAELRRFKDGRILFSIVWETKGQHERWAIPRRILRHVMERHYSIRPDGLHFDGEAFAGMCEMPASLVDKVYLASPEEKGFQLVQSAFDSLTRQLRATEDLPLSLISITAASSGLRGTSAFVPGPTNLGALGSRIPDCASHISAQDIVLTFESSGRWPDDLKAIQAMKLAFMERLATLLPTKISDLQAHVALDDDAEESLIQDCSFLELILPSGFAFRARIHHERERVLLERIVSDKRFETPARREEAARCLARWERRFVTGPSHHAALATLQHRFIAFSDTTRLVKRWLTCQMLDSQHVPEEIVELLCTSVFISQGAAVPSSGASGFLQVIQKLATWNWRDEPLLLPLRAAVLASDETPLTSGLRFQTEKRLEAMEAFKKTRSTDPSISNRGWFIATEEDVEGRQWGELGPSGPIAHSIQQLAKGVCALLSSIDVGTGAQGGITPAVARALFTPSTKAFDFAIHLCPQVLPRYGQGLHSNETLWTAGASAFRNQPHKAGGQRSVYGPTPRVEFDPATKFLTLLRSVYGDSLRLFFDPHGGATIGGMWNPSLVGEEQGRKFKVGLGYNSAPVQEGDGAKLRDVSLNTKAILAEMERLGEGLIERIELIK